MTQAQELQFGVNDGGHNDNSGTYTVEVIVEA